MNLTHGGRLFSIAAARGWHWRDILDFSANINPLGPSPAALDAILESVNEIAHYPPTRPADLLDALSEVWNIPADSILPGNGATDLIHFLGTVFANEPTTLAVPVFSEFHRAFPSARQVPVAQPEQWPSTGLVVLTRPVNPTGEIVEFTRWLAQSSNPVIIDESFIEFAELPSFTALLDSRPNLIILRSLTKFYGIPGLRVGAVVASPPTVTRWLLQRDPWSLNMLAIRAAAAAVRDIAHGRRAIETVRTERALLFDALGRLPGVTPYPSHANYLFAELAYPAANLAAHLEDRKILIRDCSGWPGIQVNRSVRVAVRTRMDNLRLVECWKEFPCEPS